MLKNRHGFMPNGPEDSFKFTFLTKPVKNMEMLKEMAEYKHMAEYERLTERQQKMAKLKAAQDRKVQEAELKQKKLEREKSHLRGKYAKAKMLELRRRMRVRAKGLLVGDTKFTGPSLLDKLLADEKEDEKKRKIFQTGTKR
jgi:hypothetical protein